MGTLSLINTETGTEVVHGGFTFPPTVSRETLARLAAEFQKLRNVISARIEPEITRHGISGYKLKYQARVPDGPTASAVCRDELKKIVDERTRRK